MFRWETLEVVVNLLNEVDAVVRDAASVIEDATVTHAHEGRKTSVP